jgi:phosphodiesterase/alkaline phosphatase D-like protein
VLLPQQLSSVSRESQYAAFKEASLQNKIMSDTQMSWLVNNMKTAPQKWKGIGNQVQLLLQQAL